MDRLDKDKAQLVQNQQSLDPEQAKATIEIFALALFKRADDADRASNHSMLVLEK